MKLKFNRVQTLVLVFLMLAVAGWFGLTMTRSSAPLKEAQETVSVAPAPAPTSAAPVSPAPGPSAGGGQAGSTPTEEGHAEETHDLSDEGPLVLAEDTPQEKRAIKTAERMIQTFLSSPDGVTMLPELASLTDPRCHSEIQAATMDARPVPGPEAVEILPDSFPSEMTASYLDVVLQALSTYVGDQEPPVVEDYVVRVSLGDYRVVAFTQGLPPEAVPVNCREGGEA